MTMTPEEKEQEKEYLIQQAYNNLFRKLKNASIFGFPVDLNDDRMVAIALYYQGLNDGNIESISILCDED